MATRTIALRISLYVFIVLIGMLAGFFVVFAFLFTDSASNLDYYVVRPAGAFLIYMFLGLAFGVLTPSKPLLPAILLGIPAVLVLGLIALGDLRLLFSYLIASFGSATLGAFLGARLWNRRKRRAV